jgi:hypothetical protein
LKYHLEKSGKTENLRPFREQKYELMVFCLAQSELQGLLKNYFGKPERTKNCSSCVCNHLLESNGLNFGTLF